MARTFALAALVLLATPLAALAAETATPKSTPEQLQKEAAQAAEAAQQAAAKRFYRAVSAATAEFVKLQVEGESAAAANGKNGTAAVSKPLDVPNPLALISPNQTAELVLNMYPVGAAFTEKKPEAQQAAVRLRMEMAAATANLTAAVKLEQAQRALAANLVEGAALLKELKAPGAEGKQAVELCPLAKKDAAQKEKDARAACLAKATLEVEQKLNGTADVVSWLQWQESRLNTNLIFFLNWAFGANNVTDGRMIAPVVVVMSGAEPVAATPKTGADGKPLAAAATTSKPKVTDVLLFQGGGPLSKKTADRKSVV